MGTKRKNDGEKKSRKRRKKEKDSTGLGEQEVNSTLEMLFSNRNFQNMKLKKDHSVRPLWVCPDHKIFLETFSPIYKQAYDFLVAIAEPVSRPQTMHEYVLTRFSLYAAVSVGLQTEDIIKVLDKLSKTYLTQETIDFIRACTSSYGKIKLVLQNNRFFVESFYPDILKRLLKESEFANARKPNDPRFATDPDTGLMIREQSKKDNVDVLNEINDVISEGYNDNEEDEDEDYDNAPKQFTIGGTKIDKRKTLSFEIDLAQVEVLKKRAIELEYPMLEEFDFKNDPNPTLNIDLRPTTNIRSYQEKALSKMFGNGRARSGIIVLPCGAGKSLVGVTATCTVKKNTIVLCTSSVSVEQWRNQFKLWSDIKPSSITTFTSDKKERATDESSVVITTYHMMAYRGKRAVEAEALMEHLRKTEWGLMVLDEVHVVPADIFRRVISTVHCHCKLGLTATLLREDDKTKDLNFLIGPKLYEANWLDLQNSGYLAEVQCAEVWCPMTREFYNEYLRASAAKRKQLYVLNPNKMRACEYLIKFHEERGDKIIVFSDNLVALKEYAQRLQKPMIYGETHQRERMQILKSFQSTTRTNTILLSKVGDTSIDLPAATVIIQVSAQFGSRRQEAQRLGRILRPKGAGLNKAYFYTLVSQDTQETYFSGKRQQFLIDQGYQFQVLTNICELADQDPRVQSLSSQRERLDFLRRVLSVSEQSAEERLPKDMDDITIASQSSRSRRSSSSLSRMSMGGGSIYAQKKKDTKLHPLYSRRHK